MILVEYAKLVSDASGVEILKIGYSGKIVPSDKVVDYISILFSNQK